MVDHRVDVVRASWPCDGGDDDYDHGLWENGRVQGKCVNEGGKSQKNVESL
jgi:hypothetical protein